MCCSPRRRFWNTNWNHTFQFFCLLILIQSTASEPRTSPSSESRTRNVKLGHGSKGPHEVYVTSSTDRYEHSAGWKVPSGTPSAKTKLNSLSPSSVVPDFQDFGKGRERKGTEVKDGVGHLRLFKYIQSDQVGSESPSEELPTDRSLIPNSYFSSSASPSSQSPSLTLSTDSRRSLNPEKYPVQEPSPTTASGVNGTLPSASERPRRSPYHHSHRAPLYSRPSQPSRYSTSSPSASDFDPFSDFPEEPSFNHARYKRPSQGRRIPPQRRRIPARPHKPRPALRHRPMNLPVPRRPHNRPVPIGIPAPPQYSYPKNAANIQDILSHFQNENEGPAGREQEPYQIPPYKHPLSQATSSSDTSGGPSGGSMSGSMGGAMGGDFSKELHDVQTSLLKDIREFARRPNMMSGEDFSHPPPSPAPTHTYTKRVPHDDSEHEDPFEPKPKPVRDLIRPKPSVHDREESLEEPPKKSTRPREKEAVRWREREESEERARTRHRDREREISEEEEQRPRPRHQLRERPRPRHKYGSSHSSKYKEPDPGSGSYEHRDRTVPELRTHRHRDQQHRHRDEDERRDQSSDSSYHRSHPQAHHQPVVLKRPYGPYRHEVEPLEPLEMQRKNQFWNSVENFRVRPTTPRYKTSYRPEPPVEDIVEIHTDSPYRIDLERAGREREERERVTRERERKAALHKLYLDYLEADGVGTTPAPIPTKTPMRMKIHIYPNQKEPHEMGAEPSASSYAAATPPRYNYPPSYISPSSVPSRGPNIMNQGRTGPSFYNPSGSYSSGMGGTGGVGGMTTGLTFGNGGTGPTGVGTAIDKNKNLVLHLHVHRRTGLEAMEAQPSQIHTSTAKPLTYKDIYEDHVEQQEEHEAQSLSHRNSPPLHHPNHAHHQTHHQIHQNHQSQHGTGEGGDGGVDKSVSMELPIQDAKIEDVLHTLLKLRQ